MACVSSVLYVDYVTMDRKNNNDNFYSFNINFNTLIIRCEVTVQTEHSEGGDLAFIQ
jgi:hypothetical protein